MTTSPRCAPREVAGAFCERWAQDGYRFGIINFANPDMVGHTGVIAVRRWPRSRPWTAAWARWSPRSTARVAPASSPPTTETATTCSSPTARPNTAHSTNPVPLIVTVAGLSLADGGILADVAPTALALLGIEQPAEMTGRSLIGA